MSQASIWYHDVCLLCNKHYLTVQSLIARLILVQHFDFVNGLCKMNIYCIKNQADSSIFAMFCVYHPLQEMKRPMGSGDLAMMTLKALLSPEL